MTVRRFFLRWGVFLVLSFSAGVSAQAKTDLTAGKVDWPADYLLEVMRPQIQLGEQKQYLANVVQNLILDELTLQRSAVTRGHLSPNIVEYPLRKSHEALPADERAALLAAFPKPVVLPLKIVRRRDNIENGHRCDAVHGDRYVVFSNVAGDALRLKLEVILCQGKEQLHRRTAVTDEQEIVAAVSKLMNPVRAKLTGDTFAALEIETVPPRASVYLDNQFLGKTPLKYSYLIPGTYQLAIKHDGYNAVNELVAIANGDTLARKVTLAVAKGGGILDITTDPGGAKIYLDADFKGLTPRKLEGLTFGTYRMHLLSPGKGEFYKTITLNEKQPRLKISESLTGFLDKSAAGFWVLSYKSWYWVSLSASAVSFGAAIGFFVWRDQAKEDIFGRLSGKSTTLYTEDDYAFLAEKNAAYDTRNSIGTGLMVGAGVFATLAIFFYVQHLLSADEGIVMKSPQPKEKDLDIRLGAMQGSTGVSVNFRF